MVKAICSAALVGLVALVVAPLGCGGGSSGGKGGQGGSEEGGESGGEAGKGGKGGSAAGGEGGSSSGGKGGASQGGAGGTATGGAGGAAAGGAGGESTGTDGGSSTGGKGMSDGGTTGGSSGSTDGGAGASGDGSSGAGGNDITGMYGSKPIDPVTIGLWIGKPGDPKESGGGPFIYLFSGAVTCATISGGSGWLSKLPKDSQMLEMIVGTTKDGTTVQVGDAGPGKAEVNYAFGMQLGEHNASGGTVTVTTYKKDMYVDGTIDVKFPLGSAKGTFHAVWCPTGYEL